VAVDLRNTDKLALALGGGVVLGAAHVGVLQVLAERDIRPTLVVGTSAGAIVGAGYAAGLDPYALEELVLKADWGAFGSFSFRPGLGILDTGALRRNVDEILGVAATIEGLRLPFAAVATDMGTRESVLLDHGSLADALCASVSIPGLFRPTRINGRVLIDGGVMQNLPLEAAFDMGAEHVIGVRLVPEWDEIPQLSTSAAVHSLEIGANVTIIRPRLGQRSPWAVKDIPCIASMMGVASNEVMSICRIGVRK